MCQHEPLPLDHSAPECGPVKVRVEILECLYRHGGVPAFVCRRCGCIYVAEDVRKEMTGAED